MHKRTDEKHTCYLAIGSNLGDRLANLELVSEEIEKDVNTDLIAKSAYIETEPYGVLDQPDFMNGALKISTSYSPEELLIFCNGIEKKAGRVKTRHWGERTLDVDIIFYGDLVYDTEKLKIPHVELCKRDFVLGPLLDIAPDFIHPVEKLSIRELLERLKSEK